MPVFHRGTPFQSETPREHRHRGALARFIVNPSFRAETGAVVAGARPRQPFRAISRLARRLLCTSAEKEHKHEAYIRPDREEVQAPRGQELQAPRDQDEIQAPRGQDIQAPRGQDRIETRRHGS